MLRLRWLALALVMDSVAMGANEAGVMGWRGDGTGIYPSVTPPTKWQLISEEVAGLRFQAMPPSGEAASGSPMPDGIIREWLVAGPIADKDDPLNVENQSALSPKAGDKFGAAEWKAIKAQTAYVDFKQEFKLQNIEAGQAAYVLTYVYSPNAASFLLNLNHTGTANVWVNGKAAQKGNEKDQSYAPPTITLTKGWNRLLIRCTSQFTEQRPKVGQWNINASLRTTEKGAKYVSQGIKWRTMLPAGSGFGGPIAVGGESGKIFLLSEPSDLVCLDAASGKILWIRSNNYNEFATDAEKQANPDLFKEIKELEATLKAENESFVAGKPPKLEGLEGYEGFKVKVTTESKLAKLMKQVDDTKYAPSKGQDVGYAGFTPVTDGKYVWAWFATGVTCCYDLDGKLIWRRLDNEGSFFEHGYSVSPVLVDGKLIVFMNKMIAFDAKTGERLWTTPLEGRTLLRFHGTPAVAKVGGASVLVLPTGHIIRVSDGKMIRDKGPGISQNQQEIPSPVAIGNTAYTLSTYNLLTKMTLPDRIVAGGGLEVSVQSVKMDVSSFPYYYLDWFMASPLIDGDLAYCVNNSGVLNVVDTKSMTLLYQKLLDIDHFQNTAEGAGRGVGVSPTLAGGNIYLVGNYGTTLVIKPGRTDEQISKNKIESVLGRRWGTRPERFVASPIFAGKNMFLRGERYLYCLGE
ncbi:MAG: PQQ-binding-like beta-propeller repeat protein [Phycisphaerales bacterium]|nr:PQQ-binding-like beta-propeller repeat protein [Phycisphaerales bacterium]